MLKRIFSIVVLSVALLMLTKLIVPRALASPSTVTFTVDSTLDLIDDNTADGVCTVGSCSLRAAIMQANIFSSGPGVTIIVPSGTYTLTRPPAGIDGDDNGDLNLTTPTSGGPAITIIGAGASMTIIDANQLDRVFRIQTGRTVSITGVTIRNGSTLSNGGGLNNDGTLTVSNSAISGNQDSYGGGVYNSNTLIVTNSTISGNQGDFGGGVYNSGSMNVTNSTIYGNSSTSSGGGVNNGGAMNVTNSTIYGNQGNPGGGVYNGTTLNMTNSTIYGNSSTSSGGGLYNDGYLFMTNSTISQNNADTDGGGIYSRGTTTALYNTSVIGNDADHDRDQNGGIGGGVYNFAGKRFIVVNTLIAGNTILDAPIDDDCNGTLEGYGWNLFGEVTGCAFSGNGTASRGFISLNTIGPLQDNGGPTWTQALLAGSEAIDATIDSFGCVDETGALLTTDQRGWARPVGVRCDVGAFEYRPQLYIYLPLVVR